MCVGVCECVSADCVWLMEPFSLVDMPPQKYRLVMSALFQGVCDGMPGALFPPSFSFPAQQTAIKPYCQIENYTHAAILV